MSKKATQNSGRTENLRPHQWKPGQSGNPGGRPKKKILSEAYKAVLEKEVPDDPQGRTFAELIADGMAIEAVKGKNKVNAAGEMADRTEGKPRQAYEVKLSIMDELPALIEEGKKRAAARRKK